MDVAGIGGEPGDGMLSGAAGSVALEPCAGGSGGGGSCAIVKIGHIKQRTIVFNTIRMGWREGWAGTRCSDFSRR